MAANINGSGPKDGKVYIGGLGTGAEKAEINTAFVRYGRLTNLWIARNPPGFAFVEYADSRDAEDAINALDGTLMNGNRIRVQKATGKMRLQSAVVSNTGSRSADRSSLSHSRNRRSHSRDRRSHSRDRRSRSRDRYRNVPTTRSGSQPERHLTQQQIRDMYRSWSRSRSRSTSRSRSPSRSRGKIRSPSGSRARSRHERSRLSRPRSRYTPRRRIRSRSSSSSLYSDDFEYKRKTYRRRRGSGSRSYTSDVRSRSYASGVRSHASGRQFSSHEQNCGCRCHGPEVIRQVNTPRDPKQDPYQCFDSAGTGPLDSFDENAAQILRYNGVDSSPIHAAQSRAETDLRCESDAGYSRAGKKLLNKSTQTDYYLLLHFVQNDPDKLSENFLRLDRDRVLNSTYHPEIIPSIFKKTLSKSGERTNTGPSAKSDHVPADIPSHCENVASSVNNLPDSTLNAKQYVERSINSPSQISESSSITSKIPTPVDELFSAEKSLVVNELKHVQEALPERRESQEQIEQCLLEDSVEPSQRAAGDATSPHEDISKENSSQADENTAMHLSQPDDLSSSKKKPNFTFSFKNLGQNFNRTAFNKKQSVHSKTFVKNRVQSWLSSCSSPSDKMEEDECEVEIQTASSDQKASEDHNVPIN